MRCSILVLCAALAAPLALSACGYAPPPRTDTTAPQYQADLETCQDSVPDAVDKHNAKTGLAWLAGGVTRWPRINDGVNACMDAKGWGHTRACTAEDRRTNANVTVTREGIRCSAPS